MTMYKTVADLNGGTRVLMTDAEEAEIVAQQSAAVTASIQPALANARYAKETGGFVLNGVSIQTDRESRSNLTGALIIAQGNANYSVVWKTDAGFVTLNAAQIIAISNAVAEHVRKCFSAEASVTAVIANYTTPAAVIAAFEAAYTVA